MKRTAKKKARRAVNYKSKDTPATLAKQAEILRWLSVGDEGFNVVEVATILGCSRQLALYHVKKLAAKALLVMVLEPCPVNGGLQYRVWDRAQLIANWNPPVPSVEMRVAA